MRQDPRIGVVSDADKVGCSSMADGSGMASGSGKDDGHDSHGVVWFQQR